MNKLDAHTLPIGSLLSQKFFFRVPEYQRPFSWDADNFEDLIDDITGAAKDQDYFLGTIVLHHREDVGIYDIVDGQQRLTSTMILLACLRDLIVSPDFKRDLQNKILQQKNVVDGIEEKVRLEVKDRTIFTDLVLTENGTSESRSEEGALEPEWRYIRAVKVFREKLTKLTQDELKSVVTFLSQKCIIIFLATPAFDDAFRLFTIVNDRGKQLRRIDILKAINIAPDVIPTSTVRNRVAQEWEEIEKQLGAATFENVFFLVRLILLKDKPQGDLLKEFDDRIFKKGLLVKGEPFFNLVFDYAKLYESIFIDRDFIPEPAQEHNKFRALIHIMDAEFGASEWRACLLAYGKRFGTERFYEFCLLMEKVYLAQWVKGVRKDERFASYAGIIGYILGAKKPDPVFAAVDYDADDIREAVRSKDIYSTGFGKYLLLRLELATAEHDVLHEFHAKSVEHVLPQNPESNSQWAKTHTLNEIKDYVNTIGNLVLLSKSKNSGAKNYDFAKKKTKYLENRVSDYPRSVQVLKFPDWTRKTIEERSSEAEKLILQDP